MSLAWGGVGWGGVGHVNVRWTLYMMFLLRDDPSLELVHDVAATRPAIRAYASSMAFFFVKSITRKVSSAKNTGRPKRCGVLSHWWHRQLVEDDESSCAQFVDDNQRKQNQQKDLEVHKKLSMALGESD